MSKPEEKEDKKEDLTNPDVVTKYRKAGDIANDALNFVISKVVAGAKIIDVCIAGDEFITDATSKVYKGKTTLKGVGFPTCISVNNIVGHYSPLSDDTKKSAVESFSDGDLVKIDLGVHIDGYNAVVAHSFVLGEKGPITGRKADAIRAANYAADCALRLLKAGKKNTDISDVISKVAAEFNCNAVRGVLSHQVLRNDVDGEKMIANRPEPDQKVEVAEFAPNEVYIIDIVISTGDGKPNEIDERTTIYKKAADASYALKMKASRSIFSQIIKNHPHFPFSIRQLDQKLVKFGIVECANHNLVTPFPVLFEKEGEFVAHVKFTALLLPNNTMRITGVAPPQWEAHEFKDKAILELLATGAGKKKKKKKKGGKKAAGGAKEEEDDAEEEEDN